MAPNPNPTPTVTPSTGGGSPKITADARSRRNVTSSSLPWLCLRKLHMEKIDGSTLLSGAKSLSEGTLRIVRTSLDV